MQLDTMALKWSYSKTVKDENTEWFELLGYKKSTENLTDFFETHKSYYVTLCYFINGKDLAQQINENSNENIIEVIGNYFNRLSFNLQQTAIWHDKEYKWEQIILKRLLGYSVSSREAAAVCSIVTPTEEILATYLQEEILNRIMIYGCGCQDVYCGGVAVIITMQDDTVTWDIQGFRKYTFDKLHYVQVFQEILSYIEYKTTCFDKI